MSQRKIVRCIGNVKHSRKETVLSVIDLHRTILDNGVDMDQRPSVLLRTSRCFGHRKSLPGVFARRLVCSAVKPRFVCVCSSDDGRAHGRSEGCASHSPSVPGIGRSSTAGVAFQKYYADNRERVHVCR